MEMRKKGRFSCLDTGFCAKYAIVRKQATSRKNGSMMKSAQGDKRTVRLSERGMEK